MGEAGLKATQSAVSGLPGIRGVDADPDSKLLNLDAAEGIDKEAIREAIEEAGFHPEEA